VTTLPDTPKGRELEEFFAALLQTTGHYVEKNIEEPNILELDVAATDYEDGKPRLRLFEVKGTPPQLGDIFKLIGRMAYLGLDEGAFIATAAPRDRELSWFRQVCEKMRVQLILVPDLSIAPSLFEEAGFGQADALRHQIWRFSYWIERLFVDLVRELRIKSEPAGAAIDYYRLVNNEVFLTPDPVDKVAKLYAAYQEHPYLTSDIAQDLAPQGTTSSQLIGTALRSGEPRALAAGMYFEHRGRLSILRAATDYLVQGGAIDFSQGDKIRIDFRIVDLPQSFLRGLTWLGRQPRYWLFPVFWQNFLWAWGGLLPDDHREDVLAHIEDACGMERGDSARALQALDQLFPTERGWIRRLDIANYEFVLMTPFQFQGVGAFHQLMRAGLDQYRRYVPSGQYTAQHFASRHNAAAALVAEAAAAQRPDPAVG
jgi:hypothetical protein